MELSDVYVGQRVYNTFHGKGRVLNVDGPAQYLPVLVEWDNHKAAFHDGGGRGKPGHCYYVDNRDLEEVISEPAVEISLSLDSILSGE